jgi:trk system potassium uptake protein TrkH
VYPPLLQGPPTIRRLPQHVRAALAILLGFATIVTIGTVLLASPFASRSGQGTGLIVALFTSVSAASDTGLAVVDTGDHWNVFGQAVLAVLMFLGGIGIMAGATLAVLLGRRATLERRAQVTDSFGGNLGSARDIVRGTLIFAVAAQLGGAVAFMTVFLFDGSRVPQDGPIWNAVFQSISAFNNAGLDLVGGGRGFTAFVDRPLVLLVSATLIVLGGLGFVISLDVASKRRWRTLALETKLVVVGTVVLIATGWAALLGFESSNSATLGALPPFDRLVNGLFMAISPRSAGFASIPMSELRAETDLVLGALMFIGGASGSTAGGIKVGTLAVLVLVAVSVAGQREEPEAFGRRVPSTAVYRAIAVSFLFAVMNAVGIVIVAAMSSAPIGNVAFETVSAFGTVGLSLGGTAEYGDPARIALTACMFLGRLGPLAVIILLFGRRTAPVAAIHLPEEPIRIG